MKKIIASVCFLLLFAFICGTAGNSGEAVNHTKRADKWTPYTQTVQFVQEVVHSQKQQFVNAES